MTRYTPLWLQGGTYPAAYDRQLIQAVFFGVSGTINDQQYSITGTNMNVTLWPNMAVVALLPAGNGRVLCNWDANETVTIPAAPPAGQSRIDLIVLQVRDNTLDGGGFNDFVFQVVQGTATTGPPSAPAVPTRSLAIAQVAVAGGSSVITSDKVATLTQVVSIARQISPVWLDWNPIYTPAGMVVAEAAHSANHAKYKIVSPSGQTGTTQGMCYVSFSKVLQLAAGFGPNLEITLPVPALNPRQVFSGDAQNVIARCCSMDDTNKVTIQRYDTAAYGAGSWHFSFNGLYPC